MLYYIILYYIILYYIILYYIILYYIIQGDKKVSAHLMFTIKSSGAQRLFDHPVLYYLYLYSINHILCNKVVLDYKIIYFYNCMV